MVTQSGRSISSKVSSIMAADKQMISSAEINLISAYDKDDVFKVACATHLPLDFLHPTVQCFKTLSRGNVVDEQNALSVIVEFISNLSSRK